MNKQRPDTLSDTDLKQLLQRPTPPPALEATLLAGLQAQADAESRRARTNGMALGLSLVANVALITWLAAVLIGQSPQTPDYVFDAYAHVQHESELHASLDPDYSSWFGRHVKAQEGRFDLQLAKICDVGDAKVKHLRYDSASSGAVNLIVYPETHSLPTQGVQRGALKNQNWVALRTPGAVSALMFYDHGVSSAQLDELLSNTFPDFKPLIL